MSIESKSVSIDLSKTVTDIVAAYVSNNHVAPSDLPKIIDNIHDAIKRISNNGNAADSEDKNLTQAQIKKSITHDALVSFIDGKRYKTLKRHLAAHNLTPDEYRSRFGLPSDYPMTSPAYSELRSAQAKLMGLGRIPHNGPEAE